MSFWRTSDDNIRWLVIIGLVMVLSAAKDLSQAGAQNLRWIESLSLAVACLAAAPPEEPTMRGLPWQRQLRTPSGLLAAGALVAVLGLFLWHVVHG